MFVGDIDIDHKPFREILEPLRRFDPCLSIAFIHDNHDSDSHEHWEMLHDAGNAVVFHGFGANLSGIWVAGLGGHFVEPIWLPPARPFFATKQAAMSRGVFQYRGGQRSSPEYAAIRHEHIAVVQLKIRAIGNSLHQLLMTTQQSTAFGPEREYEAAPGR